MEENIQQFLDLIRRSHRGRFKIYIGMIAGVGKTFRMLQDAREMLLADACRPLSEIFV